MKKSKKFLALLLAVVMIVTVVPLTVFAATSGDWEYDVLEDGTAEITKYNGNAKNITIPDEIGGHNVTSMNGYVFSDWHSVESIAIGKNISNIDCTVFEPCDSLREIKVSEDNKIFCSVDGVLFEGDSVFPLYRLVKYPACKEGKSYQISDGEADGAVNVNLVRIMEPYAFKNCKFLESITIPGTLYDISSYAFEGCTSLKEVVIKDSETYSDMEINNSAFRDCTALKSIKMSNSIIKIGDSAFSGCISLEDVQFGNGVKEIDKYSFNRCVSLKDINIPESVTSISYNAFCDCTSLTKVIIPDSVISIGSTVFYGCTSLESIEIGKSLGSDGSHSGMAFHGCKSLREINVSEDNLHLCSVNGVMFNKDKTNLVAYPEGKTDKSYEIPGSVTHIGSSAFYQCNSLENIVIPNGVTHINDNAFRECASLKNVSIPNNVIHIGSGAFYDCALLNDIVIPNGVISIEEGTFAGCKSFTSIVIPDSVTNIGDYAFDRCTSLQNVEIGKGVTTIENIAFSNCTSLKSITIPQNVTEIEYKAFGYYYGSDHPEDKIPGFTIYGVKGTEAERYANYNDFKFIEIGSTEPKPGDIDGDNEINANDAVMIQRYVAGIGTLSAEQLKSADLNNDGIVDEADAIKILRIDAGLEK